METGPEELKENPNLEKLKEELASNSDWVIKDEKEGLERFAKLYNWTAEDIERGIRSAERDIIFKENALKIAKGKKDSYLAILEAIREKE